MTRKTISYSVALLGLVATTCLVADIKVPADFEVRLVATGLDQPMGIDTTLSRRGNLFVAESGADGIVEINPRTGQIAGFVHTKGSFPVGVACFESQRGMYMYVGNAMGDGIVRCDPDGSVHPFAMMDKQIAGVEFGYGPFGKDLYASEWRLGKIWRVDRTGEAELFAELPGAHIRHMEFSDGGAFGNYLYFTDFAAGNIYRVNPRGVIELFSSTGMTQLAGLDFSRGGTFGMNLYVGDLATGLIFRVDATGHATVWADGFEGAADIIFKPGGLGGVTMYLVDGQAPPRDYTERPIDLGSLYEIAPRALCPWDLDGDGMVGTSDVLDLLGNWGPNPGDPADINGDGNVDVADLIHLLGNWGVCL